MLKNYLYALLALPRCIQSTVYCGERHAISGLRIFTYSPNTPRVFQYAMGQYEDANPT